MDLDVMASIHTFRIPLAMAAALCTGLGAAWLIDTFAKPAPPTQPVVGHYSLDEMIADVKAELTRLQDAPGERLGVPLSEIELTLSVERATTTTGSAGLEVPIYDKAKLTAEGSRALKRTSEVKVVLAPPTGTIALAVPEPRTEFADLLIATRSALQRGMSSAPALSPRSVEVLVKFVLTRSAKVEGAVEATVVSFGNSAETVDAGTNQVKLKFGVPSAAQARPTPP